MKNQNFEQILTFEGLLYQKPLPMKAKFDVLEQIHGLRLHAKFHLDQIIL